MQEINLDNPAWGTAFYREIEKLADLDINEGQRAYREFFFLLIEQFSTVERLQFNTLFSRISYICSRFKLSGRERYNLHYARRIIEKNKEFTREELSAFLWVLSGLIEIVFPEALRPKGNYLPLPLPEREHIQERLEKIRVVIVEVDINTKTALAHNAVTPEDPIKIHFDERYAEAGYGALLVRLARLKLLPIECVLINVRVNDRGLWMPSIMVVEPDYLIDVTAVASCFKYFGIFTADAIVKKYLPRSSSKPILIGQAVNHILDGLVKNPETPFDVLFKGVFKINPLGYAVINDADVMEIAAACHRQYHHLKNVISQVLPQLRVALKQCILEPSFYSPSYGIQGRLDVLHLGQDQQIDIIELKSGKPFKPNVYGLSEDHYIQTLLYDILIQTTYTENVNPTCYILYSKLEDRQLRHAPFVDSKIQEAVLARNRLVIQEKRIASGGFLDLVKFTEINKHPYIKGFLREHLANFNSVFSTLNSIEQSYVQEFSGFIAREHYLSKLGDPVRDRYGMSALWRERPAQKKEHLSILTELVFSALQDNPAVVTFNRVDKALVQFRAGDIVVIYRPDTEGHALSSQLLKGSIVVIDENYVEVRLRSTPLDPESWSENSWNIEHDIIDSQFYQLYSGLFSFAAATQKRRQILMGLEAPAIAVNQKIERLTHLTDEQQIILERMISAEDYFLLWGPPGTGKTSVMLRTTLDYLINNTEEEILVVAYTNRAVDEICDQIKTIDHPDARDFLRIGSRYSCGAEYRSHLLIQHMDDVNSRAEIKDIFNRTRIVVGTLASIGSKSELWQLKIFSRLLIDEASQILEPQLIGLLAQFKKVVMIGDHKQLPAVSQQSSAHTILAQNHLLQKIACPDLSRSLFERLFMIAQRNKWSHVYSMLSHQGRMHVDIMEYVNDCFYQNTLSAVDHVERVYNRLSSRRKTISFDSLRKELLWNNRLIYLKSQIDFSGPSIKVNRYESKLIVDVLRVIDDTPELRGYTIGIITPFRAQIAQVLSEIPDFVHLENDQISVDTVERYQGSARDIIIISASCNHLRQLSMISSLSDGVDRKLNVAITRAREQVILIGNKAILGNSEPYKVFIDRYEKDWNVT